MGLKLIFWFLYKITTVSYRVIAFFLLPIGGFAIALSAWIVDVTSGLIEIYSQFQNEADPY